MPFRRICNSTIFSSVPHDGRGDTVTTRERGLKALLSYRSSRSLLPFVPAYATDMNLNIKNRIISRYFCRSQENLFIFNTGDFSLIQSFL